MKYQNYYMGYIVAISVEICTVNNYKVRKRNIYPQYGDFTYTIADTYGSDDEVSYNYIPLRVVYH